MSAENCSDKAMLFKICFVKVLQNRLIYEMEDWDLMVLPEEGERSSMGEHAMILQYL